MQTFAGFCAYNFEFFKIYGVSARTRKERFEPVRAFCGQRINFLRFCADVIYGRLFSVC